jgi:hypothetical protein
MTVYMPQVSSARPRFATADVKTLAFVVAATAVVCVAVLVADQLGGVDHYLLVRDPNAIANNPGYFGLVSNVGIVLWIGGAVAAFQACAAAARARRRAYNRLLLCGGSFAALMGFDDLFMLHEMIASQGILEVLVLVPHGILLLALCYQAWLLRERTPWLLLAACVGALGCSMGFDMLPVDFGGQVFVEESFKLLGVALLTAYLILTSQKALQAL